MNQNETDVSRHQRSINIDTTSSNASIEDRLERIEQLIITSNKPVKEKDSSDKTLGKGTLAAAFGFFGFKASALIGGKLGLLADLSTAGYKYGIAGIEELARFSFGIDKKLANDNKQYKVSFKWTLIGAAVASIIGAIGGALIGWNRGDRLDKSSDLLTHPIESLKKIFKNKSPQEIEVAKVKASNHSTTSISKNRPESQILAANSEASKILPTVSLSK